LRLYQADAARPAQARIFGDFEFFIRSQRVYSSHLPRHEAPHRVMMIH